MASAVVMDSWKGSIDNKGGAKIRGVHRSEFWHYNSFLVRQLLQDDQLPFGDVLSEAIVAKALADHVVECGDRV